MNRRSTPPSSPGFHVRLLLALLAALPTWRPAALAGEVGDVLPFRIVHGRPPADGPPALATLWSEGGRLKLRIHPGGAGGPEVEGELRMSRGGIFKDVRPVTENLRVRMPRPDTLSFDGRVGGVDDGLDVVLSGDFLNLTVDLRIDGERRPGDLAIGEHAERPAGLPAQLNLDDDSAVWVERFGFR